MLRTGTILLILSSFQLPSFAQQLHWTNVDSLYSPLPPSVHIFFSNQPVDTGNFRAFYLVADLQDKKVRFTTDTSAKRRLTPDQFYLKDNRPLLVVNCTFFSFETNRNLNLVIKDGKIVSNSVHLTPLRGKDTLMYAKNLSGAIGISKKRKADVAWVYSDSLSRWPVAFERNPVLIKDSSAYISPHLFAAELHHLSGRQQRGAVDNKWKMETAIGGGPVLLQEGGIKITNNEERKFTGNAISDKHPRTAIGYTKAGKLIILMVEGRNPVAGGATLLQEARLLQDLGCVEALNLDGGGSSCMLINGKETIKPSDKEGQRAVPAVFIIR